ncbi:hypothetical protein SALBM135S_04849 [Streptomyces alboniger]
MVSPVPAEISSPSGVVPAGVGGADHLRQHRLVPEGQLDQVGRYAPVAATSSRCRRRRRGRCVRRAGLPEELPHQPVGGLHEGGHVARGLRLRPRQPAQLGHRLRGLRHASLDGLRPGLAAAERVDQAHGRPPPWARRSPPTMRGAHGVALRPSSGTSAFGSARRRRWPARPRGARRRRPRRGRGARPADRRPRACPALGALQRVRGRSPGLQHGARVRVADDDARGIGRTVQPGDYPHARNSAAPR